MSRNGGNQRARRRGSAFEYRVARSTKELGSYVYKGVDGDVATEKHIIECKYRTGWRLQDLKELGSWIDQAKRNAAAWARRKDPRQWVIAFTGGGRTGTYVILPLEYWLQLEGGKDETTEDRADR